MNDVVEMKTVKMLDLETLEIVELKVEGKKQSREERHVHDNSRCMHAKGLKCKCKCHAVFHGWAWKSKLEKIDRYLAQEQSEPFFESIEDFLKRYRPVLEKATVPNLYEANKALEALP